MPAAEPYPYIYVNADGTARELHAGERAYLETEFKGGDGAMPYIKDSYEERNNPHENKKRQNQHLRDHEYRLAALGRR